MFFFFCFLFIIIFLILISRIEIQLNEIHFSTLRYQGRLLSPEYCIIIRLLIFRNIPICKIQIRKNLLEKIGIKEKVEKFNTKLIDNRNGFDKNIFQALKKIKIEIEEFKLNIEVGLEDSALTAFLIPVISTAVSLLIRNQWESYNKQYFSVTPIYQNKNILKLDFNGIFQVKLIHIIYIIYILLYNRKFQRNSLLYNARCTEKL